MCGKKHVSNTEEADVDATPDFIKVRLDLVLPDFPEEHGLGSSLFGMLTPSATLTRSTPLGPTQSGITANYNKWQKG